MTVAAESPTVIEPLRGATQAAMRLDAFPATAQIFFLSSWGEFRAGIGAALVNSTIDAWGERSGAARLSVAYMASYDRPVPLSRDWTLQPGLAVCLIPDMNLVLFAPRISFRRDL